MRHPTYNIWQSFEQYHVFPHDSHAITSSPVVLQGLSHFAQRRCLSPAVATYSEMHMFSKADHLVMKLSAGLGVNVCAL